MKSKGISVFVSHIIAVAILFAVLMVVSVNLYGYYFDFKENIMSSQSKIVSDRIAENILKLYVNYKESDFVPIKNSNITLSEIYLNIPEKISGNNYKIYLEQRGELWIECDVEDEEFYSEDIPYTSVKIEVEGKPSKAFSYPIYNIVSAYVNGSAERASRIKLSYVRENHEDDIEDYILMERVL